MKRRSLFRTLYVALAAALALGIFVGAQRSGQAAALKTVIVQLKGDPVAVAKYRAEAAGQAFDVAAYRRQLVAAQDNLLSRAKAAGVDFLVSGVNAPNGEITAPIQFRFNYVYNGVTLEVPAAAVPVLEKLEGVEAVHEAEQMFPHLDRAVSYVRASDLYGSPARTSQFDEMNTGGLHGEGMIVAVIDTGIDWAHPMFGGDPTPPQFGVGPALAVRNQKVIYYLNLTAGAPQDDFGHGSHVAGAVAGYGALAPGKDMIPGTADDVRIHGIAPQAKLMGYKTLSTVGTGLNPSTIMAVEDAVQPFTVNGYPKPVAHVINLSLGSTVNDPNSPTSVACDNATLAGVTVVASAGNSGAATATNPTGEATIGSPGTGRRVLTVGANNDPGYSEDFIMDRVYESGRPNDLTDVLDPAGVARNTTGLVEATGKAAAPGQRTNIQTVIAGGSPTIGNPVAQYYVFAGTVQTPADVPDTVSGRIAIARPSGAFAGAAAAIAAKGAAGALLIRPDLAKITVGHSLIPVWSITESDARYLLDLLASADPPGVDPAKGVVSEYPVRIKAGAFTPAMASFSSKGPVGGFGQVKPDVTATGVGILSATVRVGGVSPSPGFMFHPTGYVSASGTSMSSPVTAGVAALVKQRNPQWTPAMIRAALTNTATNLRHADGTPVADGTQSVNDQGGGLIDANAAANALALMGTGTPGPTGSAPMARANQICPTTGVLCGASPGNPDFSGSYSFGQVQIAGVEGTAKLSRSVNIIDVREGAGAGTYELSASVVRGSDGTNFRVKFTDASGNEVSSVEVPEGGSASFNVTTEAEGGNIQNGSQIQFYVTAKRADGGQRLRMPFYYRAVAPTLAGAAAPQIGSVGGNEVASTPATDVNGAYELYWGAPASGPQPSKYRVEESQDGGGSWAALADVNNSQTFLAVGGRGNGDYQYRVVGLYPVEYGLLAGPASAAQAVRVERRVEQDVTGLVEAAIADGTLSFSGGFTQFEQTLRNNSSAPLYAPLQFVITSVQSSSGRVAVANADNRGNGTSTSPAAFGYSNAFGPDFAPGETSGTRQLRFSNPGSELFQFTAVVRAHVPDPAHAGASSGGGTQAGGGTSGGTSGGSGGEGSGSQDGTLGLPLPTAQVTKLTFTVNPLTRTVKLLK